MPSPRLPSTDPAASLRRALAALREPAAPAATPPDAPEARPGLAATPETGSPTDDTPPARGASEPTTPLSNLAGSAAPAPPRRRAINATGRVFDPALGSPPLDDAVLAAMRDAASRPALGEDGLETLLARLAGAERALVVAAPAAGFSLVLTALAGISAASAGGEVVVSRGDLFDHDGIRIADLVAETGAQLFEVGSIERTEIADFRRALTPATRALLALHRPRALVDGAVTPGVAALRALGRAHAIPVVHAFGGGNPDDAFGQPGLRTLVADGADIVVCASDLLLGGPRAGLLLGRDAVLGPIAARAGVQACSPDRILRAGLAATLALHRDPAEATRSIPALRLLAQDRLILEERATRLQALLAPLDAAIVPNRPPIGGGIRPERGTDSVAVSIALPSMAAGEARAALAAADPAVAATASGSRLLLDVLALDDRELGMVAELVRRLAR